MRHNSRKGNWSSKFKFKFKGILGLPTTLIFCSFFLAGFYGSSLLSQDVSGGGNRMRARQLETDYNSMPYGKTGDDSLTSIPFQVLSWYPRALYFPNFATAEQCERIIGLAKPRLKPSILALREGETVESTKGVRTSSGMFLSASDDTGTLDCKGYNASEDTWRVGMESTVGHFKTMFPCENGSNAQRGWIAPKWYN